MGILCDLETELLLTELIEESSEVIKETSKILRFGFDSYNPNDADKVINKELLENEIRDFIAIVEMLIDRGLINHTHSVESINRIEAKKQKVEKYNSISKKLKERYEKENNVS